MNENPLNNTGTKPVKRIKTLLGDDSPLMLKVVAEVLEQASNFDLIGSATNGCQALRYVLMFSPELVLIDAHLPLLDGIQATRYIKHHQHPPTVIIITSDDSPALKAAAELAGADGFVRTDINFRQQMIDTLRKVFAPPGGTPSAATEEPHARSVTCDEKSENEKSPIMNHRSRCARWRIATSPRKNQPADGHHLRRVSLRQTHGLTRAARCGATTQNKTSK